MKHIFISYKKPEDADFAVLVANRIEKTGFSPWIDNDKLEVGKDWRQDIDQAIKESGVLIVVMSPEARDSQYVTYEWAFALGAGINVIPILLKKTHLHPRLEALQYLDFTSYNHRPWDELIKAIQRAVSNSFQDMPYYIKQAIAALYDVNSGDREGAINILAEANYNDILIEALSNPYHDVRSNTSKALGNAKEVAAVPGLINALQDASSDVRRDAAWALGAIGDPEAVSALLATMFDANEQVRSNSIWALGEIRDKRAVPGLIEGLRDQNEEICRASSKALGKIKEAVPSLLEALTDPSNRVQHHAKQALANHKEALPALLEALHHPDIQVCRHICWVLGAIKDEKAVPGLLEALNDPDAKIRRNSSWALGEIKSVQAVPGLIIAVNDPDFAVRINSIKALGAVRALAANPVLAQACQDTNKDIQALAKAAIKRINRD